MSACRVPCDGGVGTWFDVCSIDDLDLDRGACALVESRQIALFRLSPDGDLYAISNYDPFSDACVLSRGIVGSVDGVPTVASPVYKQRFDLRTGRCIDDSSVALPVYRVRTLDGRIVVALP
ncbi:MAG TPA: nitrite reductase small subunit NirD [Acidimicrobiales bacterium]|nr:nitrite reductase small subunit NirD [Acidimicrobiales bacterium]